MLRETLKLIQEANGVPLTVDAISRHLGVQREVAGQLVHTLVQRGRLVEIDEGCSGCSHCPLKVICTGAPQVAMHGYALPERTSAPASLAA